jgi:hypothetical protein
MHTKIELNIELENKLTIFRDKSKYERYSAIITVVEADERFSTHRVVGKMLSYKSSCGFKVYSKYDRQTGDLTENTLIIPSKNNFGRIYRINFSDDQERYDFLKRLLVALDDWCNYSEPFDKDSTSYLKIVKNNFIYSCKSIN